MGEWHSHLGAPLYYEEKEDMHEMTADQLAQLEDAALRIKAEQNPQEPTSWRKDAELYQCFIERLKYAEQKHPVFAEGPYQGLAYIEEEVGELVKAVTKGESAGRIFDEALDVLVTAWRFARNDWKTQEDK